MYSCRRGESLVCLLRMFEIEAKLKCLLRLRRVGCRADVLSACSPFQKEKNPKSPHFPLNPQTQTGSSRIPLSRAPINGITN